MTPEIQILRLGKPYASVETVEIVHHATGESLGQVGLGSAQSASASGGH